MRAAAEATTSPSPYWFGPAMVLIGIVVGSGLSWLKEAMTGRSRVKAERRDARAAAYSEFMKLIRQYEATGRYLHGLLQEAPSETSVSHQQNVKAAIDRFAQLQHDLPGALAHLELAAPRQVAGVAVGLFRLVPLQVDAESIRARWESESGTGYAADVLAEPAIWNGLLAEFIAEAQADLAGKKTKPRVTKIGQVVHPLPPEQQP
jgi:hypothetical protein